MSPPSKRSSRASRSRGKRSRSSACTGRPFCTGRRRASPGSSATARAPRRRCGLDVVCDFRAADVAAGGEGAPLAPIYHAAMTAGLERPLMVAQLGRSRQRHLARTRGRDRRLRHRPRQRADRRFPASAAAASPSTQAARSPRAGAADAARARGADARPLFRPAGAEVARPQPFRGRRRRAVERAERRRRRRDPRRLHRRGDRRRAEPASRRRRSAGWSAAEGAATPS